MITGKLKNYFPLIKTRDEIVKEIKEDAYLSNIFNEWNEELKEEFLNVCSGVKGVKILYDAFFKEVFNPEYNPERLENFMSLLLKQKVKILKVLPNDSTRLANESSLLIMDMVVELEDHSIANIEVQKVGYMFVGQRAACYSSDLLLRQYKRVKVEMGKKFSYRKIKSVYTIVFFETSPSEFKEFGDDFIHMFEQKSDTGLDMELLQKYVFVALDVFKYKNIDRHIENKLDAWLTFLSFDDAQKIIELITDYPQFKSMYEDIYEMCRNMEDAMGIFSEELLELDRNTVSYMIDEMQKELDGMKKKKSEMQRQNDEMQKQNEKMQEIIMKKDLDIEKSLITIKEKNEEIQKLREQLNLIN